MAQAIACDLCQQEQAALMQTNLANGDTIAVGDACTVTFFASSLQAMLSGAPPEMLNDLAAVLTPLAAIIGPGGQDKEDDAPPHSSWIEILESVGGTHTREAVDDAVADALQNADDERSEAEQ